MSVTNDERTYTGTKYSHLKHDEFLNIIEDKRKHSPIIEELATRLNNFIRNLEVTDFIIIDSSEATCPVCEAKIFVLADEQEQQYTLSLNDPNE